MSTSNDFATGPVKDSASDNNKPRQFLREVKEYHGDPPSQDGKIPIQFPINEKCGVKLGNDRDGNDRGKCKQSLVVVRVKNTKFEWDEHGIGGQLIYDETDQKAYMYCPIHGPFPPGAAKWRSK